MLTVVVVVVDLPGETIDCWNVVSGPFQLWDFGLRRTGDISLPGKQGRIPRVSAQSTCVGRETLSRARFRSNIWRHMVSSILLLSAVQYFSYLQKPGRVAVALDFRSPHTRYREYSHSAKRQLSQGNRRGGSA